MPRFWFNPENLSQLDPCVDPGIDPGIDKNPLKQAALHQNTALTDTLRNQLKNETFPVKMM